MRHLVEVMLVPEGKEQWARAVRDRRSEQEEPLLPLPSMSFSKTRMRTRRNSGSVLFCGLMRCLCEGVDKETS